MATGVATAAGNGDGICGDVTGDEDINRGDVARLLYNVSYPGEYELGCCEG